MARAKKTKPEKSYEHSFDEIREDLAEFIDKTVEFADAARTDIESIVETLNQHAKAGNETSERVDNLSGNMQAHKVLLQGARDDIKRERQAGAFAREELLSKIERLDDKLYTELSRMRERIAFMEESLYELANPPSLWERIRARFGSES